VIITIDGPAGAGKSTIAKAVARKLGISYLDTGAMYRALTLKAIREAIVLDDAAQLVSLARRTKIQLKDGPGGARVLLDGEDVSEAIRAAEVTNKTFYIAREPKVRTIMVEWQRLIGREADIVVEGRDIGTVVFPQAVCKFYLDADFGERAQRRIKELKEKGQDVDEAQLTGQLKERDERDFTRAVGPLKKADDAISIDSTKLSVDQVVDTILEHVRRITKA